MEEPKVTFIQHHQPALTVGKYNITLKHNITINKAGVDKGDHSFPDFNKSFAVVGNRFNIAKTDINSVFPAAEQQGEFSNCLAHIVFNRKTLPWEELLDDKNSIAPSMCLLIVNESESIPAIQHKTLSDLTTLPSSTFFPVFTKEIWENNNDKCDVIDLPVTLFNTLMPIETELDYLAHARQVNSANKANHLLQDYAIIVGNRLPLPGKNTAYLISLIGWKDYLPGKTPVPAQFQFVRLVVLTSWSFINHPEPFHFSTVMQGLSIAPGLSLWSQEMKDKTIDPILMNAISMGYSLLPHHTRLGNNIISWYRGPLIPYKANTKNMSEVLQQCHYAADKLVNYDTDSNLMNMSYAAAWQLGRLLAIQHQDFSYQLFEWKRKLIVQNVQSTSPLTARIANAGDVHSNIPEELITWLAQLALFANVPFHYLVPDEKMLPLEAIRFFSVDQKWMRSLLEGAYSLGPLSSIYQEHTNKYLDEVYNAVLAKILTLRECAPTTASNNVISPAPKIITGFLLRSKAISVWPGLEVHAHDANQQLLPILRLEHITPNLMLCLIAGEMQSITIQQPAEGIHFGIELSLTTKNITIGKEQKTLNVPYRVNQDKKVVDIGLLADRIKSVLNNNDFTSAEFARAMVEGVEQVKFSVS